MVSYRTYQLRSASSARCAFFPHDLQAPPSSCPACRGQHRPHTRVGDCILANAPADDGKYIPFITQFRRHFLYLPARSAGALLRMSTKKQTADTADTATLEARRKRNAEMPKGRFQNRSSIFFKPLNLSSDPPFSTHKRDFMHFSGSGLSFRSAIFDANEQFSTKFCEIEAHFFLKT